MDYNININKLYILYTRWEEHSIRKWLKNLRLKNGLTMLNMGKKMGITLQAYSQIENGLRQKNMRIKTVNDLSKIFKISANQILKMEAEEWSDT